MAVIYAQIHRIRQFREQWEALPPPLEAAVSDRDTQLTEARNALNRGITEAEAIRDKTYKALLPVREEMEKAKRTEDGPSQALSRRLAQCEHDYEQAQQQLDRLQNQRDRFDEVSARCVARQDQALMEIKKLGSRGGDRLAQYIQLLQEAKRAILEDAPAGSGSFLTPDGGYLGARELTGEECAGLQRKTGWSEKTLKKCQLRPDGSVWLKTNNSIRDGETYNGTWFQRDTVVIGDVRVEGIFPKFDAAFEPDTNMPASLWKGRGSQHEAHFAWCRAQLKAAVGENPALAARFTAAERRLIQEEKPLPGYTWHHHQQPGKMQLVPSQKHSAAMHGVNHTGGNALWCTTFPD